MKKSGTSSGVLRRNSTMSPTGQRMARSCDRRSMASTSPSTRAMAMPTTVTSTVTRRPRSMSGRISRANSQSHVDGDTEGGSLRRPERGAGPAGVEASPEAALEEPHDPGDPQRDREVDDEGRSEDVDRVSGAVLAQALGFVGEVAHRDERHERRGLHDLDEQVPVRSEEHTSELQSLMRI